MLAARSGVIYANESPQLARWLSLFHPYNSARADEGVPVTRTSPWEQQVEDRLDKVEDRLAAFDTAISIGRWLGPILVGIAGVIVGKLL